MSRLLERVVAQASLVEPGMDQARQQQFSVAHNEAVLKLREQPRRPFEYCRSLLRAGQLLGGVRRLQASVSASDTAVEVTYSLEIDGLTAGMVELSGLLAASLAASLGARQQAGLGSVQGHSGPAQVHVGRSVNEALGQAPLWLELSEPGGTRRWERDEDVVDPGLDPYRERMLRNSQRGPNPTLVVVMGLPPRSFAHSLRAWWDQKDNPLARIAAVCSEATGLALSAAELETGVVLSQRQPAGVEVALGDFAQWRFEPDADDIWLTRDGLRMVPLGAPLTNVGVAGPRLRGAVACDAVQINVDGSEVVVNASFHVLAAWLDDAQSAVDTDLTQPIAWPDLSDAHHDTQGQAVLIDEAATRGELHYTWPHLAAGHDAGRPPEQPVVVLRPRERPALARRKGLRLVPRWAFAVHYIGPRFDNTALRHGSLEPLPVAVGCLAQAGIAARVTAFVHRFAAGTGGSVHLSAWGHLLRAELEAQWLVEGVSMVIELVTEGPRGVRAAAFAQDRSAQDQLLRAACVELGDMREALVVWALQQQGPGEALWQVPIARAWLGALNPEVLSAGFERAGSVARLCWRDSELLGVEVGVELASGLSVSLGDALVRLREVGGVVVGSRHRRWHTLESEAPNLQTWVLSPRGRAALVALIGRVGLWEMPIVPEAQPQPRAVSPGSSLLLDKPQTEVLLQRRGDDLRAREALAAHLLVARSLGGDEFGLAGVPLFRIYDPRNVQPRRRVSLDDLITAGIQALALYANSARSYREATVEVSAGVAYLLAAQLPQGPHLPNRAPRFRASHRLGSGASQHPDTAELALGAWPQPSTALVRESVASPLCAGAVMLRHGVTGIELWGQGLRIGEFHLPTPLRDLSGRLWLTEAGVRAGRTAIVSIAMAAGDSLVARASLACRLSVPGSARKLALAAFVRGVGQPGLQRPDGARAASVLPLQLSGDADRLAQLTVPLRDALGQAAEVTTAWLSRTAAAVAISETSRVAKLKLGKRNPQVQAALSDGAGRRELWPALVVVLCELSRAAPDMVNLDVALARVLRTAVEL